MQYQDVYSQEFVDKFNHTFGKPVLVANANFGSQIPITEILQTLGFTIHHNPLKPHQNGIVGRHVDYDLTKHIINLNPNDKTGKQRFYLCYVLGHYLAKQVEPKQTIGPGFNNRFAREFLLPRELLVNDLKHNFKMLAIDPKHINHESYDKLMMTTASTMNVSMGTLQARVNEFNLFQSY